MLNLSIITINYNDKIGLEKTIKSVINQSFKDFEYLVIDGGSTDGSKEVITQYASEITFWTSEPDAGIYNAMNKGIQAAKGEYLLFLNGGDELFEENTLKKIIPKLKDFDVISGNLEFVDHEKSTIGIAPKTVTFRRFIYDTLWHPSSFIKKTAFETVGLYDENLKIVSDWKWFLLGFSYHQLSYGSLNETVSRFFLDGVSSDQENKIILEKEKQRVFQEYFSFFTQDYQEIKQIPDWKKTQEKYQLLQASFAIKVLKKIGLV